VPVLNSGCVTVTLTGDADVAEDTADSSDGQVLTDTEEHARPHSSANTRACSSTACPTRIARSRRCERVATRRRLINAGAPGRHGVGRAPF
jgi:hypothetical protein